MARRYSLAAATLTWLAGTPLLAEVPVTLRGSPESMLRQHRIAQEANFSFFRTTADIHRAVRYGELEPLPGNDDYQVIARNPVALREVRLFVEDLAAGYRAACGDPLVVTSLTRAIDRQPSNSHPLSVHPAGMAIDLRVPRIPACRSWLEAELLALEERGVLDATLERSPPHYHVALFPTPFLAYYESLRPGAPSLAAAPLAAAHITSASLLPRAAPNSTGDEAGDAEASLEEEERRPGWLRRLLTISARLLGPLRTSA